MGTELSDEQLVELNEEFDKFAKDKEGPTAGQVACPDLPDLMVAILNQIEMANMRIMLVACIGGDWNALA